MPPIHNQIVSKGATLPFLVKGVSTDADLVGSVLRLLAVRPTQSEFFSNQEALLQLGSAMQRCACGPPTLGHSNGIRYLPAARLGLKQIDKHLSGRMRNMAETSRSAISATRIQDELSIGERPITQ